MKVDKIITEEKKLQRAKVFYFIEEVLVLLCTLVGIVLAEALQKRKEGVVAGWEDVHLDFLNIFVSSVLALIYYGSVHSKFTYTNDRKPALVKRIATALLTGVAAKQLSNV